MYPMELTTYLVNFHLIYLLFSRNIILTLFFKYFNIKISIQSDNYAVIQEISHYIQKFLNFQYFLLLMEQDLK